MRNASTAKLRTSFNICDDGLALSPEQLAQVWTPYYQGEKYFAGEVTGMELGLPMVASLVWGVGGTCRIHNREEGPGVVVELVLPLAENGGAGLSTTTVAVQGIQGAD